MVGVWESLRQQMTCAVLHFLRATCFQGSPVNAYITSVCQNYRPRPQEIQWDKLVFFRRVVTIIKWEKIYLREAAVV